MFDTDTKTALPQPKLGPAPLGTTGQAPPRATPSPFERSTSAPNGTSVIGTSEQPMRNQFKAWTQYMSGAN